MSSEVRISRKQRRKLLNGKRALVAFLLAVILLVLIVGNRYRNNISSLIEDKIEALTVAKRLQIADSLAVSVGQSFELNRSPEVDTVQAILTGKPYRRVSQPWPSGLSPYYYVERIQAKARELDIGCDCVDSLNLIVCRFTAGAYPGAVVIVEPGRNVKLMNRAVGFIIRNIYDIDSQDIVKVAKNKVPFGYFASPDVYPAGEVRKRLETSGIWSILLTPSSKDDLIARGALKQGKKKTQKNAARNRDDDKLVLDLLGRHPNLKIIGFYKQNNKDSSFVKSILRQAKRLDINYLYTKSTPDYIDSLAYSTGLTFITFDTLTRYNNDPLSELKSDIIGNIMALTPQKNMIYMIDISKIDTKKFLEFTARLREIGVNFLSFKELKETPDFIVEDL